ncbi:MAG: hypothetical protein FJW31_08035 [Acidobacteria bacterium]|nr:hypothetical protein [Acidobacteriota bacterium]
MEHSPHARGQFGRVSRGRRCGNVSSDAGLRHRRLNSFARGAVWRHWVQADLWRDQYRGGGAPLAWTLDHAGPLARTAEDAAILFNALRDTPAAAVPPLRRVQIGVARRYFEAIKADVAGAVESALGELGKLTAGTLRDADLPPLPPHPALPVLPRDYGVVVVAEAHVFHQEMLSAAPGKYHADTRRSLEGGAGVAVPEYLRARQAIERHREGARRELFAACDLLALPTAPGVAFEFERPADLLYLRNVAP